jgi:predicted esterase
MRDVIETAIKDYPVDPDRMFVAGFAGGAMEAHHLSVILQDRVKGVIANCGIIAGNSLQDSSYPGSKLAVFLSNTNDFRYLQMRENADFLKHHNWNITWIQSPAGHRWASPESYTKAVGWLDKQMNDAVLSTSSSRDSLHGFSL